ncbi:MAG: ATP-binding protein [Oscillospiraceae bacterium]|nr:ATP-binding protein [Oscillospiraceae bacterium]
MITSLKFNNCFAFNKPVEMSLKADMRTKKFSSNMFNKDANTHILKSAVIYGPNNTGKTAFISCVKAIRETLLNKKINLKSNIFNKSNICELGISFIGLHSKHYSYEFKYDDAKKEYIYEKMNEIITDKYGNEKESLIFLKDTVNKKYDCPEDENLKNALQLASKSNILIYILESEEFKILHSISIILSSIARNIEIVDMNNIPNQKTIDILKSGDTKKNKIIEFIKNADMYLENIYLEDNIAYDDSVGELPIEEGRRINAEDLKLKSVYKGVKVPSVLFDSMGTKKIEALASYVIEALEVGRTLFVDELDSSLHFKITRAIISMFNNEINKNAQLIATLHDISLLDCKRMFRKEQIWFTDKDDNETMLYSLKDFSYAENGVRETSDIQEKYSKGAFGAIPEPDLISTLLEVDDESD